MLEYNVPRGYTGSVDCIYRLNATFQKKNAKTVRIIINIIARIKGYLFSNNRTLLISFRVNPNSFPIL
ncbi:MAG: hypothetical protein ACFE9M_10660 [Promethearchaeota archaeon]